MKNLIKTLGILITISFITFLSNNSDAQWLTSSNGITGSVNITSLTGLGANIFAGSSGEGVYLSSNNGTSWAAVNNGLTQLAVSALAFSGSTLFAGTQDGVFASQNNGSNWFLSNTGIVGRIVSFAVSGTNIYAGGTGGIFLSVNNGASWTELVNDLPANFSATALAVSGAGIFAGENNTGSGIPGGIYKSTNGGNNWILAVNGLINGNVRCLAVSGTTLFAGTAAGVYVSANDGNNWSQANGGLPGLLYVNTLYASGSNVFAGTNPPGQLYMTTDNGANWIDKSQGFTGPQYVYSINVFNGNIFAAKYHSVWKRQYSEIIGIRNISTEIPERYSLDQNYPNPFNPSTEIKFTIPLVCNVSLRVYDARGIEVKSYVQTNLQRGTYLVNIDGADLSGGIYFYELISGNFRDAKKMVLIK
ncbi:MAG: T9SS type A sorting domain-containing protein [Bacteroidetes bacterium]|nr:T9SS type A sorting domain-containing protein [Bacteroidota bacterium]